MTDFLALPERILCDMKIYCQLSHYIRVTYTYKKKADEDAALALLTQKKYLRNIIMEVQQMYGKGQFKDFFECLDATRRTWLSAMEGEIERDVTAQAFAEGRSVVESSLPVRVADMAQVNRAYSLHSSSNYRDAQSDIIKKTVRQYECMRMRID